MQPPQNRRRQYVVNKRIQFQFAFLLIMQILVPTVILGTSIYVIHNMYRSCLQEVIGASMNLAPETQAMLNLYGLGIVLFLGIAVSLLLFLGIRFSHHVAGPIFKIEKSLEKLAKGEKIDPVYFRKTDMVDNIADNFNAIADKLNLLNK